MKKIILCLLVLVSCTDNTSVESQNLNQLLKLESVFKNQNLYLNLGEIEIADKLLLE